ncbi:MAG: DNA polymerase Y family protein, partial [Halofilum sp. (in: g-proteobacteria)]
MDIHVHDPIWALDPSKLGACELTHWLALHCSNLPLEVFITEEPAQTPLAILESSLGRERIIGCNTAASQAGVHPGMGRSAAHARAPELRLTHRDEGAESHALTRIAAMGLGFSDHVAIESPAGVLLEVGASRRLFGGFDRLLRDLAQALAWLGWTAVYGLAPTPAAARLLAHRGGGRIDEPSELAATLDALSWNHPAIERTVAERLAGWGIRTLGECRALPRAGVAERLGSGFGAWHDRLYGDRTEAVPRYEPPARFEGMLTLPQETAELDLPLLALERLTRECEAWLRARDAGIERFAIDLYP